MVGVWKGRTWKQIEEALETAAAAQEVAALRAEAKYKILQQNGIQTIGANWMMALAEYRNAALHQWQLYCQTPLGTHCEPMAHLGKAQWVFVLAKMLLLIVMLPYEAETVGVVTDRRGKRFIRKKKH